MTSLILTYWLWFMVAGAVGLGVGWILRGATTAGRLGQVQADIEKFQEEIDRVKRRRGEAAPFRAGAGK